MTDGIALDRPARPGSWAAGASLIVAMAGAMQAGCVTPMLKALPSSASSSSSSAQRPASAVPAPAVPAPAASDPAASASTSAPVPMAPAGASSPPADPQRTATANGSATTGLVAPEPGLYRCEGNRRVLIRRIYDNGRSIVLNWSGQDHILQAPADAPGPRQWQDDRAGLAWLAADGRATLLDLRQGQRLASDCRL